ncbi:transposase [Streptomyces sp. NPDC001530]|uniref:transposase n=1 Tax=Streptomyces sp. NPDC001530 TaxID=3364582 RepID=UPI0036AE1062
MAAPRKYPDELRERAVREVRSAGRPIAHVAKEQASAAADCARGWRARRERVRAAG